MSVRKSLAWTFSGQLTSFLITFAGSVILARLLSPREMGVYGIALATAGLISIVATLGMGSYLIREIDLTEERRASAFTINGIINIGISAIIFFAGVLAGRFFDSPNVVPVLQIMAIPPLVGIFEFLPSTMANRNMDFRVTSLIQISGTFLNTAMTVFLAAKGFSSLSMAYAMVAASLFRVMLYSVLVPEHINVRISLRDWRPALTFGLRMITVSGVAQIVQRVSDIMLGGILGLAALGIYSRASTLASVLFTNLYGTATTVIFSQLSKSLRETGALRDTFLRGLDMTLAIMWPVLIGLAILARPVVHLLYGPKWDGAALPLSLLLVAQFIVLSFGMNWELFVLRDETARQAKYEITRSFIGLFFFSIGCLFSIGAAALGRIADSIVGAIIYLPKVAKLAGAKQSDFTTIYFKSAGLTAAAVSPSALIMIANHWSPETSWTMIGLGIIIGIAFWVAALKCFGHPLLNEVKLFLSVISFS